MADLPNAGRFALCVGLGISCILKPILDFLDGVSPRSPILDAAVAIVLVALPIVYVTGVILLQLHVAPAPAGPPAAPTRFACLACTVVSALLLVLAVPLVAFMCLAADTPPGAGQ